MFYFIYFTFILLYFILFFIHDANKKCGYIIQSNNKLKFECKGSNKFRVNRYHRRWTTKKFGFMKKRNSTRKFGKWKTSPANKLLYATVGAVARFHHREHAFDTRIGSTFVYCVVYSGRTSPW